MRLATLGFPFSVWFTCALLAAMPSGGSAQTIDPDLQLIADQAGAPPNVLVLFDTSGSMKHVIWNDEFDPKRAYDAAGSCRINGASITVEAKPGTDGQCPGSGLSGDACPLNDGLTTADLAMSGDNVVCLSSAFSSGCSGWDALPDPAATGESCTIQSNYFSPDTITFKLPSINNLLTYWSENYLNYILESMQQNGTVPNLIYERRIDGGKRALRDVVLSVNEPDGSGGYRERVRFGLARLDPGDAFTGQEGGYVVIPIQDDNTQAVIDALNGSTALPSDGGTPISEALVDMGRYFTGSLADLGTYPTYNYTTTGGTSATSAPASPIDPSIPCRGNFILILTDGEPSVDDHAHFDYEFSSTFQKPGFPEDYDQDGNADRTDALDDVAAYLFEEDLIPDSVMPGQQNIVTYTVGFSLDTQLLRDTASNGSGQYFTVTTSDQLAQSLTTAITEIILRNATFSAAAIPSSRTSFGSGFFTSYFEPRGAGRLYRGHVQAYRIDETFDVVGADGQSALDPATGEFIEPRTTYFWDAALTLADPANVRNLFFTSSSGLRTPFVDSQLSAADLGVTAADISAYPPAASITDAESLADGLVNYARGDDVFDEDQDGDVTERRQTVLGDVFHSNPQLVGPNPILLIDEPGYGPLDDPSSFAVRYALRDTVLYAGANDGMLHAFDAGAFQSGDDPLTTSTVEDGYYTVGTGIERFGYVPGFLVDDLAALRRVGSKPYYVDGEISVGDAWLPFTSSDTTKEGDEWTTVLIAGMRNGERGYLALDVTDPDATLGTQLHGPYPRLLWELFDPAEPLGSTWSRPVITRVKLAGSFSQDYCGPADGDGAGGGLPGNCREEWVAIFGAGYLEQGDPNVPLQFLTSPSDPGWEDASKGIFIVSLETGNVLARVSFDAADPVLSAMRFSFPSEPSVIDLDFDGFADVVYIGDTGGQLWKWDISAVGARDVSGRVPTSTWPVGRFFAAPQASNGHYRSLFYAPAVGLVNGDLVLAFGTGERTNLSYRTTAGVDENQYYVIKDLTPIGLGSIPSTPFGVPDLTLLNGNGADPDPSDLGFYLNGGQDEKFSSDSLIFGGFVITTSYTSDRNTAASCSVGGEAALYIFSLGTGEGFFASAISDPDAARRLSIGAGLPTSPRVISDPWGDPPESKVIVQTSDGRVLKETGPGGSPPVKLIYWQQEL